MNFDTNHLWGIWHLMIIMTIWLKYGLGMSNSATKEIQVTCIKEEETRRKRNVIIWTLCQQTKSMWNNESDNRLKS